MNLKELLAIFSLFWLIFSPKVALAQEKPQVLIINQVRGEECCEAGNLENLKTQIETLDKLNLPAFFTLRYDVLTNPKFISYLQNISRQPSPYGREHLVPAERDQMGEAKTRDRVKLGLFIEITPQLASDAEVEYFGNEDDWYEAQHAYTIGYSPEDRIKLVDQLFNTFKEKFGFYPEIITAWMLDTPTLNYLSEKYGVKVQQITREQWGTDSYTLYGGSPHYPYPASENWLFMPDYGRENAPLIVRQTITDPLYNYGDLSSSFTSQPNDYLQDGKDINYFKDLINQALFEQPIGQTGFALIGLENSMATEFQTEYFQQLECVASLNNINIVSDLDNLNKIYKEAQINIYIGKDIINQGTKSTQSRVYWVSSPNYRIRLRFDGKHVYISDYRIINAKLEDPYTRLSANNQGFWITPFIIDGSRWPQDRNFLETFYLKYPWWHQYGLQTHQDTQKNTTRLDFPDRNIDESINIDNNKLSYLAKNKQKIELLFTPENFSVSGIAKNQLKYREFSTQGFPLEYKKAKNSVSFEWGRGENVNYSLEIDCSESKNCVFNTSISSNIDYRQRENQPYFFPETTILEKVNPENIDFYAHNSYAIAGRNPIRLILIIKNENSFPSIPQQNINIKAENTNSQLNISKLERLQSGVYFVDINNDKPLAAKMQLNLNKQSVKIYFAPNCKTEIKHCLVHPNQIIWYLQTIIRDAFRK